MLWVRGIIESSAEGSICNFGYTAADKVVQVKRNGAVRDSFVATYPQSVCDRIEHEGQCHAHMIIWADDMQPKWRQSIANLIVHPVTGREASNEDDVLNQNVERLFIKSAEVHLPIYFSARYPVD